MSKNRNSNREPKKQPAMTMMEKRAARKVKTDEKGALSDDKATRSPVGASGPRRS